MLVVLGAIQEAGSCTLVQIAARTGLDNKTVITQLKHAQEQAAVVVDKTGPVYTIIDLGPVIKKNGLELALKGELNAR